MSSDEIVACSDGEQLKLGAELAGVVTSRRERQREGAALRRETVGLPCAPERLEQDLLVQLRTAPVGGTGAVFW